jgi:hypothetical protein
MNDTYIWDDDSYDRLAASHVPWQDAQYVLRHGTPVIRQHLDRVLLMTARAADGRWLTVAAIETHDDTYLVHDARYLDAEETAAADAAIGGVA